MQKDILRKILIICTDHVDDMLVTTPIISAIRTQYPSAHLDVVASKTQTVVLENNVHVNTTHIFDFFPSKHQKYFAKTLNIGPNTHMIHAYIEAITTLGIKPDSHKMDCFLPQEQFDSAKPKYPLKENVDCFAFFIRNNLQTQGLFQKKDVPTLN